MTALSSPEHPVGDTLHPAARLLLLGAPSRLDHQDTPGRNPAREWMRYVSYLTSTRRDWYEIEVIDLPQAAVALYARTVVLISEPALELLDAAELQAMAAHEVGHEYVWTEWDRARRDADQERLKMQELVCDAIAVVTLHKNGIDPST